MTTFPTTLDSYSNPTATTEMDDAGFEHDLVHSEINDALEAIEASVGVNGSAVTTSLRYRLENTTAGHDHDGTDSKGLTFATPVGVRRANSAGSGTDYVRGNHTHRIAPVLWYDTLIDQSSVVGTTTAEMAELVPASVDDYLMLTHLRIRVIGTLSTNISARIRFEYDDASDNSQNSDTADTTTGAAARIWNASITQPTTGDFISPVWRTTEAIDMLYGQWSGADLRLKRVVIRANRSNTTDPVTYSFMASCIQIGNSRSAPSINHII